MCGVFNCISLISYAFNSTTLLLLSIDRVMLVQDEFLPQIVQILSAYKIIVHGHYNFMFVCHVLLNYALDGRNSLDDVCHILLCYGVHGRQLCCKIFSMVF